MNINDLINKYRKNRSYYLSRVYNETMLRNEFLDPFFDLLGWDINNKAGKTTSEREVILEESLSTIEESISYKKPDYTFRLFNERKYFLEAKRPCVNIENNNETAKQIRRYGFTAKLKISVLSNFEYLIIYDCSIKIGEKDKFNKALIKKYHFSEYEKKFNEITCLLGKKSVYLGEFDKIWKDIEDRINRYSVDDLFLKQINNWRIMLGTDVYKYQPSINNHLLNDYVQSYLNRIIFLRVCEDRNIEVYQTLLKFANEEDFKALIRKFVEADKKYDSGLFDQFLSEKIVKNISSIFWTIIRQLYYPESPYSFSVFSSDIIGNIYEIFLSDKLAIKNNNIYLEKKLDYVDKDIITTPAFIINDILRETLFNYCKNKNDTEILKIKVADIACGSGSFLLQAFQLLNDVLVDFYLKNKVSELIQTKVQSYRLKYNTKKRILLNCIYGVDKDYNAVEVTKFGLLLKLLENEDKFSVDTNIPILPNLSNNIFYGNSLLESGDIKEKKKRYIINPFDFNNKKFNIIIGNPPYMKSEDMKGITPLEVPLYKIKYKSAYKQFDKYFLFIEKGFSLLSRNGFLGFIVPNKFLKVGAGLRLRRLLKKEKSLNSLFSFGANQIFKSKTTYTCLLILSRKRNSSFRYNEIKSLSDWKIRRLESRDIGNIEISELNDDVWILVPPHLEGVYQRINKQSVILEKLVGENNIFNGIQTSNNYVYIIDKQEEDDKYIYFLKDKINWKIEKEITMPYFKTVKDKNNLNTYSQFKPNALVIFPYKKVKSGIEFIYQNELEDKYPFAYKYFLYFKDILCRRDIKPIPNTDKEWYRFGRHQSLDKCILPQKIIVGVLSKGNKYAIDFYGTLISSGGTAGYCIVAIPKNLEYSIYYIQAILNSKYIEWFSFLLGEVFRGGYIARGTKVLKKLPIRKIDFNNKFERNLHDRISQIQRDLIKQRTSIGKKQKDKRELIKLNKEFILLKKELDLNLKELYNFGNEDTLIPQIGKIYETNKK